MIQPTNSSCPKRESMEEEIQDLIFVKDFFISKPLDNSDYRLVPNDDTARLLNQYYVNFRKLNNPFSFQKAKDFEEYMKFWFFAIRYQTSWKKIFEVQLVAGTNSSNSLELQYHVGMERSVAETFGYEIGIEVGAEAGSDLFGKVSTKLSTSFSESVTVEKVVSESKTEIFRPLDFVAQKDGTITCWQKESRYWIMYGNILWKETFQWQYLHSNPYISEVPSIQFDVFPQNARIIP